ncbi:MAG: hypothetical protein KAF27_08090 [Porphyrobacter sp.]|nr:hypothetical protein [Porphyrobacter sp.]
MGHPVSAKLTIPVAWRGTMARVLALLPGMALAACDAGGEPVRDAVLIATDPVVARALHDPLMTDPDLASRNEANAAIGFADSHALPVIAATPAEVRAARDAMRLVLLEGGDIPELPLPQAGGGDVKAMLGPQSGASELLAAVGAPANCATGLKEDFALAASLPAPAAIPPRAMVVQAGGSEGAGCALRIIRYLTAAPAEDVVQFHYVTTRRAGLGPTRLAAPTDGIAAGTGTERLVVHTRKAANGLTGVTLVYRAP